MTDPVVDPNSPVGQSSGSTQGLTEFAGPMSVRCLAKHAHLLIRLIKPTVAHLLLVLAAYKIRLSLATLV